MKTISVKKLNKLMKQIFKTFKGWEIEVDLQRKNDNPDFVKSISININWPNMKGK